MMEETLNPKSLGTKRSQSERDLTKLLLYNSQAATTRDMGKPFRTPSPAREPYISSSNVNSPSSSFEYQKQMATLPDHLRASSMDSYRQRDVCNQETKKLNTFFIEDVTGEANEVEAPKTPIQEHVPVPWHGLLSPQTPGFAKYSPDTPATSLTDDAIGNNTPEVPGNPSSQNSHDSFLEPGAAIANDKARNDFKVIENDVERDASLAHQLDERPSPTQVRRSNRIRVKQKSHDMPQPSITAPRPTRKPFLDVEPTAQPELTIVPCKFEPIPFEGLHAVHTVSWQIQYPPGGSTHPSYPYPALDPRLIFHQAFVPTVNGLPDITSVPKLVLPINWKHVSWAGLLPIAFDPYRQAFKLTPVGPLPLTCEELHQSGLHKYVPGGELHPEYGMLPDMLKLSDGSDAEVFNFDGVDYTLPWEGQLDFHAPSAMVAGTSNKSDGIAESGASNQFDLGGVYPWREERDCPSMIIDLADGWRWLSTKETDPIADFIPTPGKTRHGTGAVRSARKLKLPIPELMMLALQAEEPTSSTSTPNPILQNQDQPTRGKSLKLFCPFKSIATSANVDITLLGETEFTIIELLSFFPQHFYWGHAADRLHRAGVQPTFIRNMICMTRALDDEMVPKPGTINSAAKAARRRDVTKYEATEDVDILDASMATPSPSPSPSPGSLTKLDNFEEATSYTAQGWKYDVWEKIDYPLLALAHGLQALPSGVDAGPLTALILWCRENDRYRVLLSDVPAMLKEAGIEPVIERGDSCPDEEVTGRYAEALKKDRQRVKKTLAAGKRAMKEDGEGPNKRRKAE